MNKLFLCHFFHAPCTHFRYHKNCKMIGKMFFNYQEIIIKVIIKEIKND